MHPSFDIHCENPERGLVDPHMPPKVHSGAPESSTCPNIEVYAWKGLCLMTVCPKGTMPYDCMPKGEMPDDCMPRREMPFDWMPIYCPAHL